MAPKFHLHSEVRGGAILLWDASHLHPGASASPENGLSDRLQLKMMRGPPPCPTTLVHVCSSGGGGIRVSPVGSPYSTLQMQEQMCSTSSPQFGSHVGTTLKLSQVSLVSQRMLSLVVSIVLYI